MTCRLVGISAVALMLLSALTIFVPSAFAEETDIPNADSHAQSAFDLMNLITSSQTEAATLSGMIENNGLNVSLLDDYIELLEDAAALVAEDEFGAAEALLNEADELLADVYDEIYDEIDSHQDARLTEFVQNAIDSLTFIVENGPALGLTPPVIAQLAETLTILESGTDDQIKAATSENSQIGITLLVLPDDVTSNPALTKGKVFGEELKDKLPPGIAKKYGYSNDSDLSTTSSDSETNDKEDKLGFVDKKLEQGGLPDGFEKKVDGILSLASGGDAGDLPDGFAKKLGDDGEITTEDLLNLPKGFIKKALGIDEIATIFYGEEWSPDDWFGGFAFDEWTSPFEDDFSKDKKDKKDKKLKEDKKSKKVKTDDPDKDKDKDKDKKDKKK